MKRRSAPIAIGLICAASILFSLSPAATLPLSARAEPDRKITKGIFLVADPRLIDPNFEKTVVLIIDHGPQGSTGIIINRPTKTALSSLLPKVKSLQERSDLLFVGGPVMPRTLSLLWRGDRSLPSGHPLFENVYLSADPNDLTRLLTEPHANNPFRVYAGYAGWAPGQLQAEIDRADWRLISADAAVLFQENSETLWRAMFDRASRRFVQR